MTEALPRVGVAVLNYRGADDTLACLASLRRLDTTATSEVRVIVVDNGSGDGSVARLRAAAADPGNLAAIDLVEHPTNVGFGAGNNEAIERLLADRVDFVWLLNNDATVEPATLRALLAAAGDARVGIVGSVIFHADRPDAVQTWGGGSVSLRSGRTLDATGPGQRVDYITAASALVRATALEDVGAFDPAYFFLYEDVDLGLRLRRRGWRMAVADEARVWHRGGGTSPARSPERMEHHAAGLVTLLRKHARHPRRAALPMLGYYAWLSVRERTPVLALAAWRGWRSGWRSPS